MGLVDYSESESEPETPQAKPSSAAADAKRAPAPRLINRTAAGRILVQLPGAATTSAEDGPPAKRARLEATAGKPGASSGRFSGFSSFLPPPKNVAATASAARSAGTGKAAARIGVHLKTSAEAAFSRRPFEGDGDEDDDGYGPEHTDGGPTAKSGFGGLNLPAPKARPGPSIPEGQKPEEEVQLVGKPLMFRPLSVGRKPATNKKKNKAVAAKEGDSTPQTVAGGLAPAEQKKKKVSLFAVDDDDDNTEVPCAAPLSDPGFSVDKGDDEEVDDSPWTSSYAEYAQQYAPPSVASATASSAHVNGTSLSSIADELNLSAKERRELFGRGGAAAAELAQRQQQSRGATAGAKVVSFDMAREYSANEALRAAGEQQLHNPVRAIQPGKHSLRQVVNMVQNNQDALEESFAKQNNKRREAAGRYGWR